MRCGLLHQAHIALKETDLQILTDRPLDKDFAKERIYFYRSQIEDYIVKDRRFLVALKPLAVELQAHSVVREMAKAARSAGVGPMAAVAGAIAQFLGKDLLRKGYREVVIENGGDLFLCAKRALKVGIYAGRSKAFRGLGLKIKPEDMPLGLCTSSGTLGHSLSFGLTDATVILARSAALADAVATAAGNRVKDKNDLGEAAAFTQSVKGVLGGVIIIENALISWGIVELAR